MLHPDYGVHSELFNKCIALLDAGHKPTYVAQALNLSRSTVYLWRNYDKADAGNRIGQDHSA